MFNRKNLIYSVVVILTTILTFKFLLVNDEKKVADVSINNVVLSEQVKKNSDVVTSSKQGTNTTKDNDTSTILSEPTDNKGNKVKINTYTVKSGDSLESIANTFKIRVNTIAESNNLSIAAKLKEHQILEFPSIDGVLYKIQEGDTLWDLAMLNKLDFNKIVETNKLESPEKLKLGQKIILLGIDKVKPVASNTIINNKKAVASNKTLSRGRSTRNSRSASLPIKGKLTSKYGPRWGRQHAGIDIAAPTGTNVFAFMDGRVTFSGWNASGYGNLVIIDHGNGLQSYYAHNSKLLVEKGQRVNKFTQIANVGSTGNSTGPHSHFEVRINDYPVNPYNYVN